MATKNRESLEIIAPKPGVPGSFDESVNLDSALVANARAIKIVCEFDLTPLLSLPWAEQFFSVGVMWSSYPDAHWIFSPEEVFRSQLLLPPGTPQTIFQKVFELDPVIYGAMPGQVQVHCISPYADDTAPITVSVFAYYTD